MKVSVSIITYNHEKYIAQALDSVLMQQVDFDYEIVIGEDCSTDNTRAIVLEYAAKYPNCIRLFLRERNIGATRNFNETLNACKGEYIAILDGDDYWTDKEKLSKQVAFLGEMPDFALCYHELMMSSDDGHLFERKIKREHKTIATIEDILMGQMIPTSSVCFRTKYLPKFKEDFNDLKNGDWPLLVSLAQRGKIGYLFGTMGVYRLHDGGLWSLKSSFDRAQQVISAIYFIKARLRDKNHQKIINTQLVETYIDLSLGFASANKMAEARRCARGFFSLGLIGRDIEFLTWFKSFKILLRMYCPFLKKTVNSRVAE